MAKKQKVYEVRDWMDGRLFTFKDKTTKENYSDALAKYNELLKDCEGGECDVQFTELIKEFNNVDK